MCESNHHSHDGCKTTPASRIEGIASACDDRIPLRLVESAESRTFRVSFPQLRSPRRQISKLPQHQICRVDALSGIELSEPKMVEHDDRIVAPRGEQLPRVASATSALYMTPSPSELSIFGEADVDEELELEEEEEAEERGTTLRKNNHQHSGHGNERVVRFEEPHDRSSNDSHAITKAEKQKLTRELLDALYLGTSNFLLAYNTRAGIGVLLRVFKLLLKR